MNHKVPTAEEISRALIPEYEGWLQEQGVVKAPEYQARDNRAIKNYVFAYRYAVIQGNITPDLTPEETHERALRFVPAWVLMFLAKEVGFWLARKLFERIFRDKNIGAPAGEQP